MATTPPSSLLSKGKCKVEASSCFPPPCATPPSPKVSDSVDSSICSKRTCGSSDVSRFTEPASHSDDLVEPWAMTVTPSALPPVLLCGCELPASSFISSTPKNPNRRFLKCPKMNQVVNCNCYRFLKGCFLWIWEDRLQEYVQKKIEQNRDEELNKIRQKASVAVQQKEEQIHHLRAEIFVLEEQVINALQESDLNSHRFQIQICKLERNNKLLLFIVIVMLAAIWLSNM